MHFDINPGSAEPIYRQIVRQVRQGAASGRLEVGEKLPSVRDLARAVVVNPNTIAKAYAELERDGIVATRKGMGTFVARRENPLKESEKRRRLIERIDALLTEAVHLGVSAKDLQRWIETRLADFDLT